MLERASTPRSPGWHCRGGPDAAEAAATGGDCAKKSRAGQTVAPAARRCSMRAAPPRLGTGAPPAPPATGAAAAIRLASEGLLLGLHCKCNDYTYTRARGAAALRAPRRGATFEGNWQHSWRKSRINASRSPEPVRPSRQSEQCAPATATRGHGTPARGPATAALGGCGLRGLSLAYVGSDPALV